MNTCDSKGYILAQDIISNEDLPPFDASIMDGYAVIGFLFFFLFLFFLFFRKSVLFQSRID